MSRAIVRYALSLGAGILAGFLCWLMGVPTPAPP
ncbi:XapX domain-containing protein [Streptomyces celluloflavus]